MSLKIMQRGALAATAALCLSLVGTASAETPSTDTQRSLTIAYSDIDLSKSDGPQLLYKRMASAARTVCDQPDPRELRRQIAYKACYQKALDEAVQQIGSPELTALHRTRGSRSAAG